MAKLFNLKIITPEKVVYEGRISSLVLPCEFGYLGVLADHRPLIAFVRSGRISLKDESDKAVNFQYQGTGFLEVLNNTATVILSGLFTGLFIYAKNNGGGE